MEATQVLLHIGTSLDWEIHQMDVKTDFLHGNLKEEVFMEKLEGMNEPGKENWVCYMHKTLYGLMQAVHAWNLLYTVLCLKLAMCVSVQTIAYICATHPKDPQLSLST